MDLDAEAVVVIERVPIELVVEVAVRVVVWEVRGVRDARAVPVLVLLSPIVRLVVLVPDAVRDVRVDAEMVGVADELLEAIIVRLFVDDAVELRDGRDDPVEVTVIRAVRVNRDDALEVRVLIADHDGIAVRVASMDAIAVCVWNHDGTAVRVAVDVLVDVGVANPVRVAVEVRVDVLDDVADSVGTVFCHAD